MRKIIFPYLLIFLFSGEPKSFSQNIIARRIDSLRKLLPYQKEDTNKAKLLLDIAWDKFNLTWSSGGNYDSAINYATQGLTLSNKLNFMWGKGRANFVFAKCYEEMADYSSSQKHCLLSLKIAQVTGRRIAVLNAYYIMGRNYHRMANYGQALENLKAALNVAEELKEPQWPIDINRAIGLAYLSQRDYQVALDYFNKAKEIAVQQKDSIRIATVKIDMGDLCMAKNLTDSALGYYFEALKVYEKRSPKSHMANLCGRIGTAYCKIAAGKPDSISKKKFYYQAIPYLEKSYSIFSLIGVKDGLIRTLESLVEAYKGIEDFENALTYSDIYTHARDSVFNKDAYVKIAELKIKYETEKAEATMQAERETEKIKAAAIRDSLLAKQQLQHEKEINAEKLREQNSISEQKMSYEKRMALEKSRQEKINAEKQRTNNVLLMGLVLVFITSTFVVLFLRQRQLKKRALEKAEAVHKMAELEMQSLRSQLNPHFMFNSLNSIQTLILKEESDKSQSYLSRFSRLLRMLLENAEKPFIPLQKEIDFLQLYLGLEHLRVPDLQYSISVDSDLNTEETLIPNMILQPFVENAIWHGLSYKEADRQLQIRVNRENGIVKYEIEDNGVGRKKAEELKSLFRKKHQSKGMELLNKRFKLLNNEYNSTIQTVVTDVIKNNEVAGTLVTIKVPVQVSVSTQN